MISCSDFFFFIKFIKQSSRIRQFSYPAAAVSFYKSVTQNLPIHNQNIERKSMEKRCETYVNSWGKLWKLKLVSVKMTIRKRESRMGKRRKARLEWKKRKYLWWMMRAG